MKNNKCSIFCAGTYYSYEKPVKGSLVIAADGGCNYLFSHNYSADYAIGDFDSGICPEDIPAIRLNPIKDETDTFEAVMLGIEKGCTEFHFFGATGGRTAHTIANIQILTMLAEKGMTGFIYGNNEIFTVIFNGKITFDKTSSGYISVFSLDKTCNGIYEKGLKYTLDNFTLSNTYPVGVSNEFIGNTAEVSAKNGSLLVIYNFNAKTESIINNSGEQ